MKKISSDILNKYLIDKKRIAHSISCADFMKEYSLNFNINEEKSFLAGLLHDLSKDKSFEDIKILAGNFVKRNIFEVKYLDFKLKHPFLLHGVAAAEIILNDFLIDDPEILKAVCSHTSGGENLSDLSKFTFIADFCEPKRNYKHAKIISKMIVKEKNLNKAYFYTYYFLISNLIEKHREICKESIDGYNEAIKLYDFK
jgi:predicted HD superfamily hydrolase involved in NAD metabolism